MKKEHESKANRIIELILADGSATDVAIAKLVKCHVSYVWQVRKAMKGSVSIDALDHWVNAVAPIPTGSILDEAQGIIWGDREKTYGEPDVNLKRIATLWNAFLVSRYKHGYTGEPYEITSEDVCWMMVLLKASRQMNTPKRDNLVDAAGYIGLIERIQK